MVAEALAVAVVMSGWGPVSFTIVLDKIETLVKSRMFREFLRLANDEKLNSNVEGSLLRLKLVLTRIQGILGDAVVDQRNNPGTSFWLKHLQLSSYHAEDIIDSFHLTVIDKSSKLDRILYLKIVKKDINNLLEKVNTIIDDYGGVLKASSLDQLTREYESTSHVFEKTIYGRDTDKKEILDKMKNLTSQQTCGIHVLCIIGLTGMGKTTLSQLIFHDPDVAKEYIRLWISMYEDFDLDTILKTILESIIGKKFEKLSSNHLHTEFKSQIKEKRIFLVLDNARHEIRNDWSKFLHFLNCAGVGGFILVSTQSDKVCSMTGSCFTYCLPKLSDECCWSIFQQSVFPSADYTNNHQALCDMGRQIVTKCYGIPLIAKTLGDILYSQEDLKQWECILNSELWNLPTEDNAIAQSLRVCYNHLPKYLKVLVSYFGLLSRSYHFEKETLVELWMAEDLIQPKGIMELEDLGYGYFDEFVKRGFFEHVSQTGEDNLKYQVHGFVLDMVRLIDIDGSFRLVIGKRSDFPQSGDFLRHVSIDMEELLPGDLSKFKGLRTLLILRGGGSIGGPTYSGFTDLKTLRVLDLSNSKITIVTRDISFLKQLRYFNLSYSLIASIDNAICGLNKLQTLKIRGCNDLKQLPIGLGKCVNIRHLDLDEDSKFATPSDIGMLTQLQELKRFDVSLGGCNINQLKHLNMLRNSLCISGLESISPRDPIYGCVIEKKNLKRLRLQWAASGSVEERITGFLQPHSNVKELVIERYPLRKWSIPWVWILQSSLERIELTGCDNLEEIVILRGLPFLKTLVLNGNKFVQNFEPQSFFGFDQNSGFLPSLENLSFVSWTNWTNWTILEATHMPKLGKLSIHKCPALTTVPDLSCLSLLKELNFMQCRSLKYSAGETRPTQLESLITWGCTHLGSGPDKVNHWPFSSIPEQAGMSSSS